MSQDRVYKRIAHLLLAIENCEKSGNSTWSVEHQDRLDTILKTAPSGSGWDSGTTFDQDASTPEKLVFFGGFHHIDEHGGYDGWTQHRVTVRPSLAFTIDLKVSGRNRNDIKDYLHEMFDCWLREIVAWKPSDRA